MPKDNASSARGRGSYAAQACNICRSKKVKCNGIKPVCGPCTTNGRNGECSWGRSVPAYVDVLEGMLAKCVCQDISAHPLCRPEQTGDTSGWEWNDSDAVDSDEEIAQDLCAPTHALKLDDKSGGLLHHGATAPMRFLTRSTKEVAPVTDDENPSASESYVLLLDGIDAVGYDPDLDWSRHLPSASVPLNRREHDKILDLSFKFFTSFCLRLVPCLFLRDMYRALSVPRSRCPPKTPYYSPMLHNAILGISAIFSDDPRVRDPKSRRHFVTAAKSYIEAECQKPELSLVHALMMIATFHGNEGEHIVADLYFGMCARVGQALGLEADTSDWVKSGLLRKEESFTRNWTHWSIFSIDLCWTLYVGRDFCAPPLNRPAIPLPFVSDEFDQMPWHYPSANIPPQPNFLTRTFAASTSLLLIGRRIIDVVNGLGGGPREDGVQNDNLVTEIDLELNNWKDQLPSELDITMSTRAKSTPHRLMLHCMYYCCSIVLHRPFFNRRARSLPTSDTTVDHVKLCKRGADNTMELLETWSSLYNLRYSPATMLQVIFSAGTVYMLLALHATSGSRIAQGSLKTSLAQLDRCLAYLDEMGLTWSAATRTGAILRGLLENRLKPVLARRFSPEPGGPAAEYAASRPPPPPPPVVARSADVETAGPSGTMPPTYIPVIHADHLFDEAGYQVAFGADAGVFGYADAGRSAFTEAAHVLPDLSSGSAWEEGVWGVRRGDLGGEFYNCWG